MHREFGLTRIFRYGYVNLLHDFWTNVKNEAAKPT